MIEDQIAPGDKTKCTDPCLLQYTRHASCCGFERRVPITRVTDESHGLLEGRTHEPSDSSHVRTSDGLGATGRRGAEFSRNTSIYRQCGSGIVRQCFCLQLHVPENLSDVLKCDALSVQR